ncbi:MAG: pilus assembly protein [Oscillospiraceae bacterium]|nr:pilus assembly protein [Oscillospiraceae bacterium]
MLNSKNKNEYGAVEVEATLILPMIIMIVILALYISLFICQRAILQANLETAAMYYRNSLTDSFVYVTDTMSIYDEGDTENRKGSKYTASRPLNPYRGMFGNAKQVANFEDFFWSEANNLVDRDNMEITCIYKNYVIYEQIDVSATQKFEIPIDLSYIGIGDSMEITASARVIAADHDGFINNVDYVIDILEKTGVTQKIENIASKVGEVYEKFKTLVGA